MIHKNILFGVVMGGVFFLAPAFAFAYTINSTGGDCATIGTWDASTLTCTLSQDITNSVGISSDNITLDGAGHTILGNGSTYSQAITFSGSYLGNGIQDRRAHITIKNLVIEKWAIGIHNNAASSTIIENVTFRNTATGIKGSDATWVYDIVPYSITIRNNTFENVTDGIFLYGDPKIVEIEENTIHSNGNGIAIGDTGGVFEKVIISSNKVESSGGNGAGISYGRTMSPWNPQSGHCFAPAVSQNTIIDIFGNTTKGFNVGIEFATNCTDLLASVRDNVIENNTTGLNFLALNEGVTTISRNDFLNNTRSIFPSSGTYYAPTTTISALLPEGGNYWSDYDTTEEGCNDINADGFCDDSYVFGTVTNEIYWNHPTYVPIYLVDKYPYAKPLHADVPAPSTLTEGHETENDGIDDTKGVADKTEFTFNILYTGTTAPSEVTLFANDGTTHSYPLALSATTTNDGDYTNGEWYTFTGTFPKGHYGYHFEANGGAVRFPESGEREFTTGYSNVAFLPGIKASRLFKQKENCLVNCEDQLWEPNWWTDTNELIMNPDGSSIDKNIYTKTDANLGMIDQANLLPFPDVARENFYVSFIDSMNEMKQNGDIADWKALPYDWRLAFPEILANGKEIDGKIYYDTSYGENSIPEPYIFEQLENLADTSDNGKVTIIAHSMGGLLAKKLLSDIQKEPHHTYRDLLDKVEILIMVDSPQLGTPQAIATMLHGTNENIPADFGLFSDAETGRKVAQNMKSVYTLLPSREYAVHVENSGLGYTTLFSQDATLRNITNDPLFNANSVLDFYQLKYGTTTIATYDAMADFLVGADGHFSAPDSDLAHPKRIQMNMLAEAQAIHDEIDNWVPPTSMRVVQIAGWGIPDTIRGIEYKAKRDCPILNFGPCTKYKFNVEPVFTYDGDGTVVLPSQIAMNTETYFVDLNAHNRARFLHLEKNRSHGSILEVDGMDILIQNIIEKKAYPAQGLVYIKTDISLLDQTGLKKLIRLSLHSPVKVDITDQNGNHVGISASSTPERTVYDTQMPNSYYLEMGEGKYLGFQLEASTTIQLQGTGTGTFTLNIEQYQGDAREGTQTFTDIPVSTTTKATLVINTLTDAKELALDQDGDGTIDSVIFADENKETVTFQTLKDELQTLPTKEKKDLLEKVQSAEKQFLKENWKSAKEKLLELKKEIAKLASKKEHGKYKIEKTEALRIGAIIDTLIEQIEQKIQDIDKNKHHDEHDDKDKKKNGENGHKDED